MKENQEFKVDILENICEDVVRLAKEIKESESLLLTQNQDICAAIHFLSRERLANEFKSRSNPEFWENIKIFWSSHDVKNLCEEHELLENIKYFLDKLDDIINPKYFLSIEDILRCHSSTFGISETMLAEFHMIEISNSALLLKPRRRSILKIFHRDFEAILFVVSMKQFSSGQATKNELLEILENFQCFWNDVWLEPRSFILLLNKMDLFEYGIKSGKSKLGEHFPEFEYFSIPPEGEREINQGGDCEVTRAKYFVQSKFQKITEENLSQNRLLYYVENSSVNKDERSKIVVENIKDIIRRNQRCYSCTFGIC